MRQAYAKIVSHERVGPLHYRMAFDAPWIARGIRPGQFIHVRCADRYEPLLRRPFSVHRTRGRHLEILYKVVGKGTDLLSRREVGESLDIVGPLGNGFDIDRTPHPESRTPILVAGGMGVAPLVALAEKLSQVTGHRPQATGKRLHVLIGACTKSQLLCEKEFRKLGAKVLLATEDGSCGRKGLATQLLDDFLQSQPTGHRSQVYACGPTAMLREVAVLARRRGAPCQVSLEERMACGLGVCLGCPVKIKTHHATRRAPRTAHYEYKMVCKDGPVFHAEDIIWK